MSVAGSLWEHGRRASACVALALVVALATASGASAETTFGGNPNQEVIPEVTSEVSCAPFTCTLYWTGPGGSDLAPIPAGGGSGTVTSVTLPPMENPGMMQAVVLTSSVQATHDPTHPTSTCCAVKELSAPFTVPPDQVTTVPLSLHVSATAAANLAVPGSTSTADGVGISVITAEASAPVHITENTADNMLFWAPALTATNSVAVAPITERPGYELQARFTFVEAPAGGKPPSPTGPGSPGPGAGAGPAAGSGVKLFHAALRPGAAGRTLILGRATNPPTASTRQTLSVPVAAGSAATGKARKPRVLGVGRTTVPNGRSAPLKLVLNARGRAALAAGGPLRATLTIVATNPEGESQTLTRHITIKPRASRPQKARQLGSKAGRPSMLSVFFAAM